MANQKPQPRRTQNGPTSRVATGREPVIVQPIAEFRPPDVEEGERREGVRACYFLHQNGTGLQISTTKFEVLHDCGEWTWAHYTFCGMCGQPLELREDHRALVSASVHKGAVRGAVRSAFPLARPEEGEQAVPAHPAPATPEEQAAAFPVGSFNNPAWAQRGPMPGNPSVYQGDGPTRSRRTVQATPTPQQQPPRPAGQPGEPGVFVASPRPQ